MSWIFIDICGQTVLADFQEWLKARNFTENVIIMKTKPIDNGLRIYIIGPLWMHWQLMFAEGYHKVYKENGTAIDACYLMGNSLILQEGCVTEEELSNLWN